MQKVVGTKEITGSLQSDCCEEPGMSVEFLKTFRNFTCVLSRRYFINGLCFKSGYSQRISS